LRLLLFFLLLSFKENAGGTNHYMQYRLSYIIRY
jgi:hypothetical protein